SILLSFIISILLRISPSLLTIHNGVDWFGLYSIPLWIGIELLLVSIFGIWGLIGISFSCIISSFIHPLSVINSPSLALLEIVIILVNVCIFKSRIYDGITDHPVKDYIIMIVIATTLALVVTNLIILITSQIQLLEFYLELVIIAAQMSLAIILTGYPAKVVLNRRTDFPQNWTSDWFLLLIREEMQRSLNPRSQAQLPEPGNQRRASPPRRVQSQPRVHQEPTCRSRQSLSRSDFITITTDGEVLCPNCETSNWPSRRHCRRCRSSL
ncbi:MAG: hypothetical protein ACTSWA_12025, partial [Candidatus Thorarchaeota archaeon]